jgi:hypothetical protein
VKDLVTDSVVLINKTSSPIFGQVDHITENRLTGKTYVTYKELLHLTTENETESLRFSTHTIKFVSTDTIKRGNLYMVIVFNQYF